MLTIEIDGVAVSSERDFHAIMAKNLDLGDYYRPNLSALWDILTTDVERPIEVVWRNSAQSRNAMGDQAFEPIRSLLLQVQLKDEEYGWDERFVVRFE